MANAEFTAKVNKAIESINMQIVGEILHATKHSSTSWEWQTKVRNALVRSLRLQVIKGQEPKVESCQLLKFARLVIKCEGDVARIDVALKADRTYHAYTTASMLRYLHEFKWGYGLDEWLKTQPLRAAYGSKKKPTPSAEAKAVNNDDMANLQIAVSTLQTKVQMLTEIMADLKNHYHNSEGKAVVLKAL